MIPFVSPAPLSACILFGSIVAYPHPARISCSVGGSSAGRGAKKFGAGRRVTGEYAGYLSKISFTDGSAFIIISLNTEFNFSMSWGEGCAGAGSSGRPNIISTGTGPLAFAGTTRVILMFTSIKG